MLKATGARCWPCLGWEFGSFGPLWVRTEIIDLGMREPMRLMYASDLHLGHWWTRPVAAQLLAAARLTAPDLVVLGGDLVDGENALPQLGDLLRDLTTFVPVWAIHGNHDDRVGILRLREAVLTGGGRWLADGFDGGALRLDCKVTAPDHPAPQYPGPDHRPRVLCTHYPTDFPAAAAAGYRLVLAGHLHGGQCVFGTRQDRLYPAAWLHRWHGLKFTSGSASMLVSRGMGDTFPFRFRCPREVVLCCLT
ncbi:MAG: hypothetical protein FJ271_23925 [Planctomycetes bacterium]|nr:hypothetical protein [Planctomycetota bacterium]